VLESKGALVDLSALAGKRALVTGGAGLVGSTIVDQLREAGALEVRVLDTFERGRRDNLIHVPDQGSLVILEGDICDVGLLREAMAGVDLVFHQAALRITQCAQEPRRALEVLVDGTFNVAEAAVQAGVDKVVVASSASVYGEAVEFPTTEAHHPYANRTLYGAAKTFNEGLFRSFHEMYGLPYVALRYFNVYGPRMDIHGVYTEVLVRWMERIAAGDPPLILGDGRQTMDFVYIDDIARANLCAALSPAVDVVCNVGTGVETDLNQLAKMLVQVMGADLEPIYGEARTVNNVGRRLADVTAARELLGFEAAIGLEEGLRRLVAWWRDQQDEQPSGRGRGIPDRSERDQQDEQVPSEGQ
jgi:UDP-glucose 4-epimerase